MINTKDYWCVLKVKPQHELKAVSDLSKMGVSAYTPYVDQWRQWSDRKKKIKKAIISKHIFVQIPIKDELIVFDSPSVTGYLNVFGQRAKVWPDEIKRLKDYCIQAYKAEVFEAGDVFMSPVLGTSAELIKIDKNKMCSAISSCGRFTIKFKLAS